MLSSGTVTANIPASDLGRARDFYLNKLGLTPTTELEGVMLIYQTGGGSTFSIYQTQYAGQAGHTIAQWHVDDVDGEVGSLQAKGVTFERYDDMPGVTWNGDVASIDGMGKAAWFKDTEGNILCIDSGFPS
ncbi:MAG: VOC family protein [Actinomycetota bacterium]|nr:MAG: VOC family protein [Actinomycetota bacterium]